MEVNHKNQWVIDLFKEANMVDERNLVAKGILIDRNKMRFRDMSFGRKLLFIFGYVFILLLRLIMLLLGSVEYETPAPLYFTINDKQVFMIRQDAINKNSTAHEAGENVFNIETEGLSDAIIEGNSLRITYQDTRKVTIKIHNDANMLEQLRDIYNQHITQNV